MMSDPAILLPPPPPGGNHGAIRPFRRDDLGKLARDLPIMEEAHFA